MRRASFSVLALVLVSLVAALIGTGAERTGERTRSSDRAGLIGLVGSVPGAASIRYVALGDSFTAAPRVGRAISSLCNRTDANYPHLAAAAARITLVDASCGGARVRDLTKKQKAGVPRQLVAVRRDADLVTVSIGGNDVAFMKLLKRCLQAPVSKKACRAQVARTQRRIPAMRTALASALRTVHRRAPQATVVLIGYPEILRATGRRCLGASPARVGETARVLSAIVDAQRSAARKAGVRFYDARSATRGHGLCTAAPWIASQSTVTAQMFHPTAAGQRAVAAAVGKRIAPLVKALPALPPVDQPTPTADPTAEPTEPSAEPTAEPTEPTAEPTEPSTEPTGASGPNGEPTGEPRGPAPAPGLPARSAWIPQAPGA